MYIKIEIEIEMEIDEFSILFETVWITKRNFMERFYISKKRLLNDSARNGNRTFTD